MINDVIDLLIIILYEIKLTLFDAKLKFVELEYKHVHNSYQLHKYIKIGW